MAKLLQPGARDPGAAAEVGLGATSPDQGSGAAAARWAGQSGLVAVREITDAENPVAIGARPASRF